MRLAHKLSPLFSIHPGEWYFGTEHERIHTVLGSCVALTAWHPTLKMGGLCHYLLARAPYRNAPRDCRYAVYALAQMKMAMMSFGGPEQFELGLFGGGEMFASRVRTTIGADNIEYAREWLASENLQARQIDVGGNISRSLILAMPTGEIQLKHYQMNPLKH